VGNEAKDYYSNIAAWYDRLLGVLIDPVRRALVEWIITNQPGRVLDVGCGTGKQLALLPDNVDAVGIDISESMLEQAEKQVPGKCLWADATDIPFRDGEFDLVISQFALHEKDAETIQAELREVRRVLKPGKGIFSVTDFDLPKTQTMGARGLRWGIRQIEKLAGGKHYNNYQDWMKRGGLKKIISNAGWVLIEDQPFYKGNIRLTFWSWNA